MTLVNYVLADEILGRFFFLLFQVFVDLFNNIKNWFCFFQEIVPGPRHASRGFAGKKHLEDISDWDQFYQSCGHAYKKS